MISNKSYWGVKQTIDLCKSGLYEHHMLEWLQTRGWWVRKWRPLHAPRTVGRNCVSLLRVRGLNGSYHYVVYYAKKVFDPSRAEAWPLEDYMVVTWYELRRIA